MEDKAALLMKIESDPFNADLYAVLIEVLKGNPNSATELQHWRNVYSSQFHLGTSFWLSWIGDPSLNKALLKEVYGLALINVPQYVVISSYLEIMSQFHENDEIVSLLQIVILHALIIVASERCGNARSF